MALKTSTFARFIFSNVTGTTASSFPYAVRSNQFHSECNLLHFIRKIHRTVNKSNDHMSPSSSLSPPSPEPVSEKEQIALDHIVNSYPAARRFIAIGSGGDDFADAMVLAVESVLQKHIPDGSVRKRLSSMGRYISVNIGPVQVISRDQVKAVYEAMMKDPRMRYFF